MLHFGDSTNGTAVTLHTGEDFEISLDENRTTGFRWMTQLNGAPYCVLLDERSSAPSRTPGAGGTHFWHFRAERPGVGTIEIRYRRPWESEREPARTFRLQARVSQ